MRAPRGVALVLCFHILLAAADGQLASQATDNSSLDPTVVPPTLAEGNALSSSSANQEPKSGVIEPKGSTMDVDIKSVKPETSQSGDTHPEAHTDPASGNTEAAVGHETSTEEMPKPHVSQDAQQHQQDKASSPSSEEKTHDNQDTPKQQAAESHTTTPDPAENAETEADATSSTHRSIPLEGGLEPALPNTPSVDEHEAAASVHDGERAHADDPEAHSSQEGPNHEQGMHSTDHPTSKTPDEHQPADASKATDAAIAEGQGPAVLDAPRHEEAAAAQQNDAARPDSSTAAGAATKPAPEPDTADTTPGAGTKQQASNNHPGLDSHDQNALPSEDPTSHPSHEGSAAGAIEHEPLLPDQGLDTSAAAATASIEKPVQLPEHSTDSAGAATSNSKATSSHDQQSGIASPDGNAASEVPPPAPSVPGPMQGRSQSPDQTKAEEEQHQQQPANDDKAPEAAHPTKEEQRDAHPTETQDLSALVRHEEPQHEQEPAAAAGGTAGAQQQKAEAATEDKPAEGQGTTQQADEPRAAKQDAVELDGELTTHNEQQEPTGLQQEEAKPAGVQQGGSTSQGPGQPSATQEATAEQQASSSQAAGEQPAHADNPLQVIADVDQQAQAGDAATADQLDPELHPQAETEQQATTHEGNNQQEQQAGDDKHAEGQEAQATGPKPAEPHEADDHEEGHDSNYQGELPSSAQDATAVGAAGVVTPDAAAEEPATASDSAADATSSEQSTQEEAGGDATAQQAGSAAAGTAAAGTAAAGGSKGGEVLSQPAAAIAQESAAAGPSEDDEDGMSELLTLGGASALFGNDRVWRNGLIAVVLLMLLAVLALSLYVRGGMQAATHGGYWGRLGKSGRDSDPEVARSCAGSPGSTWGILGALLGAGATTRGVPGFRNSSGNAPLLDYGSDSELGAQKVRGKRDSSWDGDWDSNDDSQAWASGRVDVETGHRGNLLRPVRNNNKV